MAEGKGGWEVRSGRLLGQIMQGLVATERTLAFTQGEEGHWRSEQGRVMICPQFSWGFCGENVDEMLALLPPLQHGTLDPLLCLKLPHSVLSAFSTAFVQSKVSASLICLL